MKKYKIAILGASGAVGKEILKQLEIANLPIQQIKCLASKNSIGHFLFFRDEKLLIEEATPQSFQGMDLVFGAVSCDLSSYFAPFIQQAHALYIDNSSYFRNKEDVPLVIPEINGKDCFNHQKVIANPNCSTIIALSALYPIHCCSPIQSAIVSTYQAVSGAGNKGMHELINQMNDYIQEKKSNPFVFDYPITLNVIPMIGNIKKNGFTDEEEKMQQEARKILHSPKLLINCTCVRVPVLRCHSISITCITEQDISLNLVLKQYLDYPQCQLTQLPMPFNTNNQDLITVGRLRKNEQGISLWCCGDQLRIGAATNAVQIAQYCHNHHLI